MLQIPLDRVASQNVVMYLNGDRYSITLKESHSGSVLCSITRNDDVLVSNFVCVFGTPVVPYDYLESGNFIFLTTNDDYPDWRQFGTQHFLFYATPEEIEGLRND